MGAANRRTTPREHGTRAKYTVDKCRCDECRRACAEYERQRTARIEPAYVMAGPARAHVRHLMSLGMGHKRIAQVSGVTPSVVAALLYGKKVGKKHRPPTKRIRPETAAALLAVDFAPTDGAYVDATDMWQQVDEMVAAGIPRTRIAEHVGSSVRNFYNRNDTARADRVRAVGEMYAEFTSGTLVTVRRSRHGDKVLTFDPVEVDHEPDDRLVDEYYRSLGQLADLLEDRNEQAEWRRSGACVGRPAWMWFPARGDVKTREAAIRICKACIVRKQCLAANLDAPQGIFGGLGRQERVELRKASGNLRPCLQCGTEFAATGSAGLCSDECKKARHNERSAISYARSGS